MTPLEYFGGDGLAAEVWESKYALRDAQDNLIEKSPDDMHRRIARELARVEQGKFKEPYSEEFIYECLKNFKYIVPQGSIMYGVGNPKLVSLSNCFVLDSPEDSYSGILWTDEQLVQISKRRGGVGFDLSNLRPVNSRTTNSARTSSGIVPFMERYSNSIREVGQNGRRGALMLTLSVHHPQVLDFARAKQDRTKVTGANVSVRLTDEFLQAVEKGETYEQRFPVDPTEPRQISQQVDARQVWMELIKCAWATAEPGLLFWDNIIRESPADCYATFGYKTDSTNPCSEIGLCPLDSCRLLVINLFGFVIDPFTARARFDYKKFYQYSQIAQRLMDDVIDLELECIQRIMNKIEQDPETWKYKEREMSLWERVYAKCDRGRRTGVGITALGDTFAALGIKYGSEESIAATDDIYKTLKFGCYRSSVDMAAELGAFPIWDKELEKNNPFLNRIRDEQVVWYEDNCPCGVCADCEVIVRGSEIYEDMQKYGRRNIALLTTAPTGTVSLLTQTTSGIEPLFKESYVRRRKINAGDKDIKVDFVDQQGDRWQEYVVYHHRLKQWMDITGETNLTKSPYHGCCAEDLDWKQRVKLQAAAQKHIDHSISSTLNLPESVSVEQVAEIYETAWRAGCKGVTVYRKNCRTGVLIDSPLSNKITKHDAPKRPNKLPCDIHHMQADKKPYFVVVGLYEGDPYEVFAVENVCTHGELLLQRTYTSGIIKKVKRGEYKLLSQDGQDLLPDYNSLSVLLSGDLEALTRMTSTALRHGASIEFVVSQLSKVKGDLHIFAKCLGRALKKYVKDGTKITGVNCPQCDSEDLRFTEGCVSCGCGWSRCS